MCFFSDIINNTACYAVIKEITIKRRVKWLRITNVTSMLR